VSLEIIHGDCLEVLPALAAGSVDCVVTDPPYGVDLKYVGYQDTFEAWCALMDAFLPEALRISSGPVIVFGASPTRQLQHMLSHTPDRVMVWAPAFSFAKSRANGTFYRWHPIHCWRPPKKHTGPDTDVLRHNCEGRHWWDHPGTKPVGLMECVCGFCPPGGTVLDPFLGSGTTLVAAAKLGLNGIGIEREAEYVEIARKRVARATEQLRLEVSA